MKFKWRFSALYSSIFRDCSCLCTSATYFSIEKLYLFEGWSSFFCAELCQGYELLSFTQHARDSWCYSRAVGRSENLGWEGGQNVIWKGIIWPPGCDRVKRSVKIFGAGPHFLQPWIEHALFCFGKQVSRYVGVFQFHIMAFLIVLVFVWVLSWA